MLFKKRAEQQTLELEKLTKKKLRKAAHSLGFLTTMTLHLQKQSQNETGVQNPTILGEVARFDRIVGDKEVFFAETLNYVYIDQSILTKRFAILDNGNKIFVKITAGPVNHLKNVPGMFCKLEFYK